MNPRNFFSELKRRNVYKIAMAYAVVGWLVIQISSTVLPLFHAPEWVPQTLAVLVVLGFPIALVIAWAFESTAEGIKRTEVADAQRAHSPGGAWIYVVLFGLAVSVAVFFIGRYTGRTTPVEVAGLPAKSIAVLPFDNLSHDPENAYFSEGIQDEILTRLAKIADLKVISRTSTQRFKSAPSDLRDIAHQLGVANIVEGSVQKADGQVRVNVQLINALTDSHLWADTYDRKLTDLFRVETEIAKTIADTLQAKLTGSEIKAITTAPTGNKDAYDLYLKGRFFWNKRTADNLRKALDYFNQAVAIDPNYALAYAGIADTYQLLPSYSAASPNECLPKAEAAAHKAVELDDKLAEAHNSLGAVLGWRFKFTEAAKEHERAIELNPNYATAHQWYSEVLESLQRREEALVEAKRAQELDPLSPIINGVLAQSYAALHRHSEAIEQFHRTIELDPGWYLAHLWLADALQFRGDLRGAMVEYENAAQRGDDPNIAAGMAWTYAGSGNQDAARKILAQLIERSKHEYVAAAAIASAQLACGNKEEALRWFEKAYADGAGSDLQGIRDDDRLVALHGDPRYEKLVTLIYGGQQATPPPQHPKS